MKNKHRFYLPAVALCLALCAAAVGPAVATDAAGVASPAATATYKLSISGMT